MSNEKATTGGTVRVSYDVTQALFASQFIISSGADELIVNFSSGHIADPASGSSILPVHTRIAMSTNGARRLIATLQKALGQTESHDTRSDNPVAPGAEARFPAAPEPKT